MLHSSQSAPVVDGKVMEFVIFAIESAAQKLGIPAPTLYNRLEKLNLIRQYLISGYDMLHTQSREYIADTLVEALENWEAVEYPLVGVGRENLDFGKGFYVTDIYAQAERWGAVMALRHPGSTSVVNIYELDVEKINSSGYKWLHFDGYNNDWLEFIVSSRLGKQPWLEYDIVEGGIANDRVFDTIENFMENQITKEVALGRLRFEQPNNQLCILNQRLIDECLSFKEYITIK